MSAQSDRQSSHKSRRTFFWNSVKTGGTGASFEATAKGDIEREVTLIRQGVWKGAGVILVALGMQLFGGLQSYAQQSDAAALADAKAAAGQAARGNLAANPLSLPTPVAPRGILIKFDVPGAVNGTNPAGINSLGVVTGSYTDANSLTHGFLRSPVRGAITTFDVPGDVNGTNPASINPQSAITGIWYDGNGLGHGFLRAPITGDLTTFDVPNDFYGTYPTAINAQYEITGYWYDANLVIHGFVRTGNGAITSFDDPDAGTGVVQGTTPLFIDQFGGVIGIYNDVNDINHGFIRARDGTFTTFDPPGEIASNFLFSGPGSLSENPQGAITGAFHSDGFDVFVRAPNGTFTTFAAADYPPCCTWSFSSGIDPAGTVTGVFNDGFGINHGFLRASNGTITTFDIPGAGTGNNQGTIPLGINAAGVVVGNYSDSQSLHHGFILLPKP
jgi:hypothetical protein